MIFLLYNYYFLFVFRTPLCCCIREIYSFIVAYSNLPFALLISVAWIPIRQSCIVERFVDSSDVNGVNETQLALKYFISVNAHIFILIFTSADF